MDAPERNSLGIVVGEATQRWVERTGRRPNDFFNGLLGGVDQIVHGQECLEPALPFLTHGMAFILHVEVSVLCYQHPAGMRLPAGRASDAITLAKMWAPKGLKRDL
jgi:hypothetical protein